MPSEAYKILRNKETQATYVVVLVDNDMLLTRKNGDLVDFIHACQIVGNTYKFTLQAPSLKFYPLAAIPIQSVTGPKGWFDRLQKN